MNSSYKLSFTFVKSSMSSITVILSTCYFQEILASFTGVEKEEVYN